MKDKKLLFDCSCHVLYSCPCKKEIRAKIALHYPEAERRRYGNKHSGSMRTFSPTGAPIWAANGTSTTAQLVIPALPYLLSFAAGAMLYVVVEELIPEMSQGKH